MYLVLLVGLLLLTLYGVAVSSLVEGGLGLQRLQAAAFAITMLGVGSLAVRVRTTQTGALHTSLFVVGVGLVCSIILGVLTFGIEAALLNDFMYFTLPIVFAAAPPPAAREAKLLRSVLIAAAIITSIVGINLANDFSLAGFDRRFFYVGSVGRVGAVLPYLGFICLFSGATSSPALFLLGIWTCTAAAAVSALGQFRGGVLVNFIAILCGTLLILRSSLISRGAKAVLISGMLIASLASGIVLRARAAEVIGDLRDRITTISNSGDQTSDVLQIFSDGRFIEAQYILDTSPLWSIVTGNGLGSSYYDPAESFDDDNPTRAIVHVNYVHWIFKVGLLGIAAYLFMYRGWYKASWPTNARIPAAYWCYLGLIAIDSVYYGIKEFGTAEFLVLLGTFNVHFWTTRPDRDEVPSQSS